MWSFNQNQGDNNQNANLGWNVNNANAAQGENYALFAEPSTYVFLSGIYLSLFWRWLRSWNAKLWMELWSTSCSSCSNTNASSASLWHSNSSVRRWTWSWRSCGCQKCWLNEFCPLHCQMGELMFIVFYFTLHSNDSCCVLSRSLLLLTNFALSHIHSRTFSQRRALRRSMLNPNNLIPTSACCSLACFYTK